MKVYLLDTEFASTFFDEGAEYHTDAVEFVEKAARSGDHIYISCIAHAEIRYGLGLYKQLDKKRSAEIEKSLNAYPKVRIIDVDTTPHYASIRCALMNQFCPKDGRKKFKKVRPESLVDQTTAKTLGIQENDLWVASIAVQYGMELVSGDKMNQIKRVYPSLKFVTWR